MKQTDNFALCTSINTHPYLIIKGAIINLKKYKNKPTNLQIMIHELILKLLHLGWLLLPFPLYALYSKHYLDPN